MQDHVLDMPAQRNSHNFVWVQFVIETVSFKFCFSPFETSVPPLCLITPLSSVHYLEHQLGSIRGVAMNAAMQLLICFCELAFKDKDFSS